MTNLTPDKQTELTQILTSLYYLSKESKSADLVEVSQLIRQCIKNIEGWSKADGKNIAQLVINEDTFHILEFLTTFANVTPKTREQVLNTLTAQTVVN